MSKTTRIRGAAALLAAAALACALAPATALAGPQLGLQLTRTTTPLNQGDERLAYEVSVENTASASPNPGDELTCLGTPEDGISWFGKNPTPEFEIEWLRDGTPIPGTRGPAASARTYTVTAEDAGTLLQCLVRGTNDADGAGSEYAPIAFATASLPPVPVAPLSAAPASGSSEPNTQGATFFSTPSGTATTTAGSKILTEVITARGTGKLTSGSTLVENVVTTSGTFEERPAQVITGPGIPLETAIVARTANTLTLSKPATASGSSVALAAGDMPFSSGQTISGSGIPSGTKILHVSSQELKTTREIEISSPATASGTEVAITGTATLTCEPPEGWSGEPTWSYRWLRNGEAIPGATEPSYTAQHADTEPPSLLQCEAIAEAGGRRAVAISRPRNTEPSPPRPYGSPAGPHPQVILGNQATSGPVTLDMQLPEGGEVYAFKAFGQDWKCGKEPPGPLSRATVSCSRADALGPESSYPPVEVVAALGKEPGETIQTIASASGGGAPEAASAEDVLALGPPVPFGFKAFETQTLDEAEADYTKAGGHPFSAGASFAFNTHTRVETVSGLGFEAINGALRQVQTTVPRGFVGNPEAAGQCQSLFELTENICPPASAVGTAVTKSGAGDGASTVYEMVPEAGALPQFAFSVFNKFVFTLTPELRGSNRYAITLVSGPLAKDIEPVSGSVTLCGFGTKPGALGEPAACKAPGDPGALAVPFLTNPTRCAQAPVTKISADSWEHPGEFASAEFTSPPLTGCGEVPFEPQVSLTPTSRRADSPTGLDVELTMPTGGLEEAEGTAQANLADTTVAFPPGMAINPAAAAGLGACSEAEVGMHAGVPDEEPVACPESSKVGTVEVQTPLLSDPLKGALYVARQGENPFHSLLAVYMVLESKRYGLLVKIPGRLDPDPQTGRLTASFEEAPETPFSRLVMHLASGSRAPLLNPPACGTYAFSSSFVPWTAQDPADPGPGETVTQASFFEIDQGPGGGPCPGGGLDAKLSAGLASPQAGATSPFLLDLSRADGSGRIGGLEMKLPPGLTAYLKGIPYCPDATLAAISAAEGSGAAELAEPSCPQASEVGKVAVSAGAGPSPLYLDTARAYLAGPYKGAPLSLAVVAPAVAGPFDLGTVVVRNPLYVDPETARVRAVSDPIPTVWHGIPLDLREIRIYLDRPHFTLAPTNCEPSAVEAQLSGGGQSATLSDRFQVGGCEALGFKPKLKLSLKGATRRSGHPSLNAVLTMPEGGANIAHVQVGLPHSEFLDQGNLDKVCTQPQLKSDTCPKGAVYGHVRAFTPLLDKPLEGPVYLGVGYGHKLPDLVADLNGQIRILLHGRVDTTKSHGLRNTFEVVPDAPVSRFELSLKGGKKFGLLENSADLCPRVHKASVRFAGQNGKVREMRPALRVDCGKGHGKQPGHHGAQRSR
ncbi:MAG TPA: hypothetical protein VFS64_10140 [Solirubrobacterales bacterium]|nr:hypothetical protein [Solirubrobacterales bacterium]